MLAFLPPTVFLADVAATLWPLMDYQLRLNVLLCPGVFTVHAAPGHTRACCGDGWCDEGTLVRKVGKEASLCGLVAEAEAGHLALHRSIAAT